MFSSTSSYLGPPSNPNRQPTSWVYQPQAFSVIPLIRQRPSLPTHRPEQQPEPIQPWVTYFPPGEPTKRHKKHHKHKKRDLLLTGDPQLLPSLSPKSKKKHKSKKHRGSMSATAVKTPPYPMASNNWAFTVNPQISTLETVFHPGPAAHVAGGSVMRRLTSDTDETSMMRPVVTPVFENRLHHVSSAASLFKPAISPSVQQQQQQYVLTPTKTPQAWKPVSMSPLLVHLQTPNRAPPPPAPKPLAAPPSIISRYNVAKVFAFNPINTSPPVKQGNIVLDSLLHSIPLIREAPMPPPYDMRQQEMLKQELRQQEIRPQDPRILSAGSLLHVASPASVTPTPHVPTTPSARTTRELEVEATPEDLPVSSARLGRPKEKVTVATTAAAPPKPPARSVSVSNSNESGPASAKKAATRRAKNRSLQLQTEPPVKSASKEMFTKSPSKRSDTSSPPTRTAVHRFASSGDVESPPQPWKPSLRMSFATPSTTLGGPLDGEWSSMEESPSPMAACAIEAVKEEPKQPPGFAEFVMGLLAAHKLQVEVWKKPEGNAIGLGLFQGTLDNLLKEREADFAKAVETKWSVKSADLIASAKLFSQATLSQVADVQKSNWFLDDNREPMSIQSQLLTHVYNASQPRELFTNYFQAGVQGLDKSLDLPKHLETRRIQNSIRRYLEYSLELFLVDVCLGVKNGSCIHSTHTSHGSSPEDLKRWVEAAQQLANELYKRPAMLATYLRSQFAFLREKAGRVGWEEAGDDEEFSVLSSVQAISGEQLDSVLSDLGWWPPELNGEDRREVLEAISLSTAKAQHGFVHQAQIPLSFDPARLIYDDEYVAVLSTVPLNQPDFVLGPTPKSFKELATKGQLNEILREVARVAKNITNNILQVKNDDAAEVALANDRIMHCVNQPSTFQSRDSVRSRCFIAQDFLTSYAVSLEELQIMALESMPTWTVSARPSSADSLSESQSSDSALSGDDSALMTPLEIGEEIIKQSKSGFEAKEEVLPCLNIVQLAVEYIVGIIVHGMSNSERFTVRAPLSTLAVRIDPQAVVKRLLVEPCPLPFSAECLPYDCSLTITSDPASPSLCKADVKDAASVIKLTRTYESRMRSRVMRDSGPSNETTDTPQEVGSVPMWEEGQWPIDTTSVDLNSNEQEHGRVTVSDDLMEIFVTIHSWESLREIQRLFIATDPSTSSTQKDAITLKNSKLKGGDAATWSEFWSQSAELSCTMSSHAHSGSWGPIRWNSLHELALVFHELQKTRST
eukprot:Blabericola_migrator_1__3052@NODE_188_length_11708_cov_118_709303_g163_i0_p2_GENE_NODE_188_length_11708_cov_118_709303_g163_i0NODE_188_length_11708_cov_118_709303_g163_i0_p2_ORF_typecomplete_len1252_score233_02_NODE_188_length_11708_cov_118_709303_g163_i01623917